MEATSPLPEILVLETTLGLGGRPPLDAAFVAVCDTVLMVKRSMNSVAYGVTNLKIVIDPLETCPEK